jgi:hypothetical protein
MASLFVDVGNGRNSRMNCEGGADGLLRKTREE